MVTNRSGRSKEGRARIPRDGSKTRLFANNARQLWLIALTIAASLIFSFGLGAVVMELLIMERNPNWNKEKLFQELDVTYEDISEEVVPYVQHWFRALHLGRGNGYQHLIPTIFEKTNQNDEDPSCLQSWFSDMKQHLDSFSSPAYMEMILDNMGLRHSIQIRKILDDYLQAPQSLVPLYNTSQTCLDNMNGVADLACGLREGGASWDLADNVQHRNYATYAVNMAVVIEVLTQELQNNLPALHELIDIMTNEGHRRYQEYISAYKFDQAAREFRLQKYEGIALTLKQYGQDLTTGKASPGVGSLSLQMNILEAVKLDAFVGHDLNARVGLALATRVDYDKNDELDWRLGKEWIDSYMTWNMAFVIGHIPLRALGKLFIPSVVCEADLRDDGKDWSMARLLSLALTLIAHPGVPVGDNIGLPESVVQEIVATDMFISTSEDFVAWRWSIARSLGQINFKTAQITPPSTNSIEHMLFHLCGGICHDSPIDASDTVPHEGMDDEQFQVYAGFIIWITVLLAGLGCEVFVWYHFLQVWDDNREGLWRFAQFIFPLMMLMGLGLAAHGDFLSLAFVVAGLWKFGFPETLMYLYLGLFSKVSSRTQRISDLLNGVGTAIHHSAAALVISMLLSGTIPKSRYVFNCCFVLAMQHWVVLLSYVNPWLYTGVELFLEFWFEWIIISEFWNIYGLHWVAGLSASVMLFAHWLYLIAAGVGMLVSSSDDPVQHAHGNVHARGTRAASRRTCIQEPSSLLSFRSMNRPTTRASVTSCQKVRRCSTASWQMASAFYDEKFAIEEEEGEGSVDALPNSASNIEILLEGDETMPNSIEHSAASDVFSSEGKLGGKKKDTSGGSSVLKDNKQQVQTRAEQAGDKEQRTMSEDNHSKFPAKVTTSRTNRWS